MKNENNYERELTFYTMLRQEEHKPGTPEILKQTSIAYKNYMSREHTMTPSDVEEAAVYLHLRGELEKLVD